MNKFIVFKEAHGAIYSCEFLDDITCINNIHYWLLASKTTDDIFCQVQLDNYKGKFVETLSEIEIILRKLREQPQPNNHNPPTT